MSSPKTPILLNPFAFPAETDARFLLLVVAVIGSTLVLADGLLGGVVFTKGYLPGFLGAVVVTTIVLIRARELARQDARQRIQTEQWVDFPPQETDPLKMASLKRMNQYIHQVIEHLPTIDAVAPRLVWDNVSGSRNHPSGVAFGFGHRKYVGLRNGLHEAFTQVHKSDRFHAVLLHELGHLENQDVNKTIFSVTLGRSFFPTALIILMLLDIYLVWSMLERMFWGDSLQPVREGFLSILGINIRAILLLALVEVIRSSVLRVREYYADARARLWLGKPDGFFELFQVKTARVTDNSLQPSKGKANPRSVWQRLQKSFYDRLAPFHPSNRHRIDALMNPQALYRPSYDMAFFSGLLSGLALNSSFLILIGLTEMWNLTSAINQFIQGLSGDAFGLLIVLSLVMLVFWLVYLALILTFVIGFSIIPIAATVGLQVQAAAFVDRVKLASKPYTSWPHLLLLSLLVGLGFMAGCMLVPVANTFSLVGASITFLLFLSLLWTITFCLWLFPLKWMAAQLYTHHTGDRNPREKRRFLTKLSIVTLSPTFIAASMTHVSLSYQMVTSADTQIPNLGVWLWGIGLVAVCLQGGLWLVGWLYMASQGWLATPKCPGCGTVVATAIHRTAHCPHCQAPLAIWFRLPEPLVLPPVPPLELTDLGPPPL